MSGWYVVLHSDLVRACGKNAKTAHFVAHMELRTSVENRDAYERDGRVWWRVNMETLADEMGSSVQTVKTSAANALELGAVVREQHFCGGTYDQTWSYRLSEDWLLHRRISTNEHQLESTNVPILPKEGSNSCPENDNENGNTPLSELDEVDSGDHKVPRRPPAVPLPADWQPTAKHREKAAAIGCDVDRLADDMRQWAFANDVKRARWDQTFNQFLARAKPSKDFQVRANPAGSVDALIQAADFAGLRALGVRVVEPVEHVELSPGERVEANRAFLRGMRDELVAELSRK